MFIGANHEVTGSCTLIEACGKRIMVDCGMEQGAEIFENCELPVAPGEIDAVCITHAHIDHTGKLPNMVSNGFCGPVYLTEATAKLAGIWRRRRPTIRICPRRSSTPSRRRCPPG